MKLFTSISIIVLLILCHIVDNQNTDYYNSSNQTTEEFLAPKIGVEIFNNIEYKENSIEYLRADTIYYSYQNTQNTELYDGIN